MNQKALTFSRIFKKVQCIIICLSVILSFTMLAGCESEELTLYFGVNRMPINIDPQKASSYGELLAVRNCFKGLTKLDKDNNAVLDLAESYKLSENKLTYTFKLKDAKWQNEEKVTSFDFIFAINRALNKSTASPSVHSLKIIKGVDEILSGNSQAELGVLAPDSNTLIFKLTRPDSNFLTKLTTAVFMPCNQKFFEDCGGKYGLYKDKILTNGDYYISSWTENRHIKLSLCENSELENAAKTAYITVSSTGKNPIKRVVDQEIGIAVDDVNDYSAVDTSKYKIKTAYQKSYAIVINKNSAIGQNALLTEALCRAINRDEYSLSMSKRFKVASSVLPPDSQLNGIKPDTVNIPGYYFSYNSQKAREDFLLSLESFNKNKLPNINVLTVDNPDVKAVTNNIVGQWQNTLGAYVNIKAKSSDKSLLSTVKNGDFTIAMIPLSENIDSILSLFTDKSSALYLNNSEYDSAVAVFGETDDTEKCQSALKKCLTILSTDSTIIPVISVPTAFIYKIDYNNMVFSPIDETVDFSIISKK